MPVQGLRHGGRRAQIFSSTFYEVELVLALFYVDEETAVELETLDRHNEVVSGLCKAIFEQASGNQVSLAAQDLGAQFDTRFGNGTGPFPDYRCTIIDTNRRYDNEAADLLGPAHFILELHVMQGVFVTATTPLPIEEVSETVALGFNRGSGGRLKFRSLLQESGAFPDLLNVEVFDQISPPQSAPSASPSHLPTMQPITSSPTPVPKTGPPVEVPATSSPVGLPSTPTNTNSPVALQSGTTMEPSLLSSSEANDTTKPSYVAPMLVNIQNPVTRTDRVLWGLGFGFLTVTILLSLCLIWRFCRRWRHKARAPLADNDAAAAPVHVVRLDDAESLADTTLGDHTAGGPGLAVVPPNAYFGKQDQSEPKRRKSRMAFRKAPVGNGIPSLLKPQIGPMESFEENSLYTSSAPIISNVNHNHFRITATTKMAPATTALAIVPPSLSQTLDFDDDLNLFQQDSEQSELGLDIVPFERKPPFQSLPDADDIEDLDQSFFFDESKEDPSIFAAKSTSITNDSSKAELVSKSMASGTKGFDPFEDDESVGSPIEFASTDGSTNNDITSVNDQSTINDPPTVDTTNETFHPSYDVESPTMSQKTEQVENLIMGCLPVRQDKPEDVRPEDQAAKPDPRALSPTQSRASRAPSKRDNMSSTSSGYVNNSLLRTVLEGASRLAEAAASSNRSRVSRKTAPPRMDKPNNNDDDSQNLDSFDILADNYDLVDSRSLASPREKRNPARRSPPPGLRINLPPTPAVKQTASNSMRNSPRYLESEVDDVVSPNGNLGAEPRSTSWDSILEDSEPVTPASTPGVLGIARKTMPRILNNYSEDSDEASEPWLMDKVGQTLGAKSPHADTRSLGGRSTRSEQSGQQKTLHSRERSTQSKKEVHSTHSKVPPSPASVRSHRGTLKSPNVGKWSNARHSSQEEKVSEEKVSEDEQLLPRALEKDLQKLEMQLAGVRTGGKSVVSLSSKSGKSIRSGKRVKKDRIMVTVPPGKLGVVLANRNDGKGTIVSEVRTSSAMHGALRPGDRLVEIDGEDVTNMVVKDIISRMTSRADCERRLTVLTSWGAAAAGQETKTPCD